ncbi:MAG: ASCH domain-containing protein [Cellulomonas sp.]
MTDDAATPAADSTHPDEVLRFWEVARVRAGVMRVAAVTGPGIAGSLVPPSWAFGDDPALADAALALVLDGTKTATSTALPEFEHADEPLPAKGDLSIVTDGAGRPGALIRTTRVETVPFGEVGEDVALAEGEGDGTLASWRAEREESWGPVLAALGAELTDATPVVVERFELLYPRPGDRGPSSGPSEA